MHAKIRIDLTAGLVEAEGSEEFVRGVYEDFKKRPIQEPLERQPPPLSPHQRERSNTPRAKSAGVSKKRAQAAAVAGTVPSKKKSLDEPKVIKTLDLSGGPAGRLRDFYEQYEVTSNFERNLIFLYFMQHKMGIEGITQDHVFTCYRDIPGIKSPVALRQGLLDTDNRKNWIDASNPDALKVSVHGVNYLEHDMPRKKKA